MAFTAGGARHRGERLNELLLTAVRFFNGDRPGRAVEVGLRVVNFKRAAGQTYGK